MSKRAEFWRIIIYRFSLAFRLFVWYAELVAICRDHSTKTKMLGTPSRWANMEGQQFSASRLSSGFGKGIHSAINLHHSIRRWHETETPLVRCITDVWLALVATLTHPCAVPILQSIVQSPSALFAFEIRANRFNACQLSRNEKDSCLRDYRHNRAKVPGMV